MKFRDEDYINFDPFEGDRDVDVKYSTVKLVRVRAFHPCFSINGDDQHVIRRGEMARYEKALFEGRWASWYMCIACMDKWLTECGIPTKEAALSGGQ